MKNCKKCNKEFEPTKGLINYCSLECRNSRVWDDKDKKKKSESAKNSEKVKYTRPAPETILLASQKRKKTNENKILNAPLESLSYDRLRTRIILEQQSKCKKCLISEWMGVHIPFELNHIDGDNQNNTRSNLEILCPNCHSITDNWRGRNKVASGPKVSDDELLESLQLYPNIRQALLAVGLAAKGSNYGRCQKLLLRKK